ncbi:phosphoribosyltransferase family protein [Cobetia sp. 14N.309.X.WAT.E.A4]|uniref:phosphoribosyltransferase family protein n=1 Tax=Cobetia sp. 14N.309.X.WAT.E.A4 TaxID=2998323 RepID=UPI0025B1D1CD|nr:phosphoribosyltransferase family protein [Cobetia sp. 14N.309.X.WAT.E.A4]MDN2657907.1 phosphoribosyltransferase family protein [Cobetia sp. 14N.309.X.WAT.E.A4]
MNYRSYGDLGRDIASQMSRLQAGDFDLIVGIPRSGMVPAYMISAMLNRACTDLDTFLADGVPGKGITRKLRESTAGEVSEEGTRSAWAYRCVLLVDDSLNSGASLKASLARIPADCPCEIMTCVIYANPGVTNEVDLALVELEHPRAFQWNLFHHPALEDACVDIDGVLCLDPSPEDNDDGPRYRRFLLEATPLHLPTYRVHSLVTNRLEKYRPETEAWLARHGVTYERLIMLDLPSKEARLKLGCHASHKAGYYRESGCRLFIESEVGQASSIAQMTGKPVYCVDAQQMVNPEWLAMLKLQRGKWMTRQCKRGIRRVMKLLPASWERQARGVFQRVA